MQYDSFTRLSGLAKFGVFVLVSAALFLLFESWTSIDRGITASSAVLQTVEPALVNVEVSQREVPKSELVVRSEKGMIFWKGSPFTGVAVTYHSNDIIAERIEYVNGKKDGLDERWYPNSTLAFRGSFKANRKHGLVQTWWDTGVLRSESNYQGGVPNGAQLEWFRSGAPFKALNLVDGQEVGLQQAWRENGKLFANYEAKDGRVFGLKRANLCYTLNDEVIQYDTFTEDDA